jgi:type II secretory pathway component PulF
MQLNEGEHLSTLFVRWRQFPEDWLGYLQNGELAGKLEESFIFLRDEAERDWQRAQETLNEWIPKILYGLMILIVMAQIFLAYLRQFNQITNMLDQIPT